MLIKSCLSVVLTSTVYWLSNVSAKMGCSQRRLRWLLPEDLNALRVALYAEVGKLTKQIVASIAGRQHILAALAVAMF